MVPPPPSRVSVGGLNHVQNRTDHGAYLTDTPLLRAYLPFRGVRNDSIPSNQKHHPVDVDYSMRIQQQSGVTLCVNSYGGEIETFAKQIIKASTIDTIKFLHDESFELRDRFPKDI